MLIDDVIHFSARFNLFMTISSFLNCSRSSCFLLFRSDIKLFMSSKLSFRVVSVFIFETVKVSIFRKSQILIILSFVGILLPFYPIINCGSMVTNILR